MATTKTQALSQLYAMAFCCALALAFNERHLAVAQIITTYVLVTAVTLLLCEYVNQAADRRRWVDREVARASWEAFYAQAAEDEAAYRRRHLA